MKINQFRMWRILMSAYFLCGCLAACGGNDVADVPAKTAATFVATPASVAVSPAKTAARLAAATATPVDGTLRRQLSPDRPMFVIHVDSWNQADPQKIINLIPPDIRPYTVLNISLSTSNNGTLNSDGTCSWKRVEYGIETARSWLKTAAANGMWAMVQPSSGGFSHFPDYGPTVDLENTVYGEFFRDYPNFLGFNYAEQYWGFDGICTPSAVTRWEHWANLLKLTNKYGGYLAVSFTGMYYGANINPLAMVKRDASFRSALEAYSKNFIIEEKFTSNYGYHDMESISLGMYLSGYAGNYGIRTDRTGWTNADGTSNPYPTAAGAPHLIEHLALTGQTFFDGPEIIWMDSIQTLSNIKTADGYSSQQWGLFPQFKNIHLDVYRKILDGTLRIMNRQEVIDRTKVVIVNDVTSGSNTQVYSAPDTLFTGLYQQDDDGIMLTQHQWYKKTGRYPAIPTVWQLRDSAANSFQVKVNKSSYAARWPDINSKVAEFNALFPQEYSGDIYASRQENTWITYNPYKKPRTASGSIPLKYNTCSAVGVTYAQYTAGVISEYPDKLSFYLTNYDATTSALQTDTIQLFGASTLPTYSFVDRGEHGASNISSTWADGVLTLMVSHNGPLDITVNCTGTATDKLTTYQSATLIAPPQPSVYTGPRQYEAEYFDTKSIGGVVKEAAAVAASIRNYQGLGYLNFGTSSSASIRSTMNVTTAGNYQVAIRYLTASDVNSVALYVNGSRVSTPAFSATAANSWGTNQQTIALVAGTNTIEFRSIAARTVPIYFDNVVLSPSVTDISGSVKIAQSGLTVNRFTGQFSGTVSFTNTTGAPISAGMLRFVLEGLTPGVTLNNESGVVSGWPYIVLPVTSIAPGATVSVTTAFGNPSKGSISYTPKLYAISF
jgi:hypothetical protein